MPKEIGAKISGYLTIGGEQVRDPRYVNADRHWLKMPVEPKYPILKDGTLLGGPKVIIKENLAASPKNPGFHSIDDLTNEEFYNEHIQHQHLVDSRSIIPLNSNKFIASATEIRPYSEKDENYINVQYTFGVQPVRKNIKPLEIKGAVPFLVEDGKIDTLEILESSKVNGLAHVGHIRLPEDLRKFYNSPDDKKLHGPKQKDKKKEELFEKRFKPKLESMIKEVEVFRGKQIKGLLVSNIIVNHTQVYDVERKINVSDPRGEFVMAASFLI